MCIKPAFFLPFVAITLLVQSPLLHAADDDLKSLTTPESNDWQVLRRDQLHNIVTWSKREDDRMIRSVKAEAIYENSFDAAARHQLDIENYRNWFMNVEEARVLKKIPDTEFYMYFRLKAPLGAPPRDAVVRVRIEPQTKAEGPLVFRYNASPNWMAAKTGIVRMPAFEVTTRLTPMGPKRVQEITEGYAQPGGVVPRWLVNSFQRQMPYSNLLGRARDIPRYENLETPSPFLFWRRCSPPCLSSRDKPPGP